MTRYPDAAAIVEALERSLPFRARRALDRWHQIHAGVARRAWGGGFSTSAHARACDRLAALHRHARRIREICPHPAPHPPIADPRGWRWQGSGPRRSS